LSRSLAWGCRRGSRTAPTRIVVGVGGHWVGVVSQPLLVAMTKASPKLLLPPFSTSFFVFLTTWWLLGGGSQHCLASWGVVDSECAGARWWAECRRGCHSVPRSRISGGLQVKEQSFAGTDARAMAATCG
jgi:hypothetical protein